MDEQDAVGRLGLLERLEGMHRVRTERNRRDVPVCRHDRTEVLLRVLATAHSELADRAGVRRLRLLAWCPKSVKCEHFYS